MTTTLCVDASIAVKWVVQEDDSDLAERLLGNTLLDDRELVAPAHIVGEVANALFKRFRFRDLPPDHLRATMAQFLAVPMRFLQTDGVALRAIEIAMASGLSTPYDAFYLALAEQLDCELWTADERFYRAVQPEHRRVRLLSDWPA